MCILQSEREYNTTVLINGQVLRWRRRDWMRYKFCLTTLQRQAIWEYDPENDVLTNFDDCNEHTFALIHEIIGRMI